MVPLEQTLHPPESGELVAFDIDLREAYSGRKLQGVNRDGSPTLNSVTLLTGQHAMFAARISNVCGTGSNENTRPLRPTSSDSLRE